MRLPDQLPGQAKTVSCDTRGVTLAAFGPTQRDLPDDTQGTQKPPGRGYTEHKKSRRSVFLPRPELPHFDEPVPTFRYYAGRRVFRRPRAVHPERRTFGHSAAKSNI